MKPLLYLAVGLLLLVPTLAATYNMSIEGQLYDSNDNIITGTKSMNITMLNSSYDSIANNTYTVTTDNNGRFFLYYNLTYDFHDDVFIQFTVEGFNMTNKTSIGYVPYAISARKLHPDENVDLGAYDIIANSFNGSWNGSSSFLENHTNLNITSLEIFFPDSRFEIDEVQWGTIGSARNPRLRGFGNGVNTLMLENWATVLSNGSFNPYFTISDSTGNNFWGLRYNLSDNDLNLRTATVGANGDFKVHADFEVLGNASSTTNFCIDDGNCLGDAITDLTGYIQNNTDANLSKLYVDEISESTVGHGVIINDNLSGFNMSGEIVMKHDNPIIRLRDPDGAEGGIHYQNSSDQSYFFVGTVAGRYVIYDYADQTEYEIFVNNTKVAIGYDAIALPYIGDKFTVFGNSRFKNNITGEEFYCDTTACYNLTQMNESYADLTGYVQNKTDANVTLYTDNIYGADENLGITVFTNLTVNETLKVRDQIMTSAIIEKSTLSAINFSSSAGVNIVDTDLNFDKDGDNEGHFTFHTLEAGKRLHMNADDVAMELVGGFKLVFGASAIQMSLINSDVVMKYWAGNGDFDVQIPANFSAYPVYMSKNLTVGENISATGSICDKDGCIGDLIGINNKTDANLSGIYSTGIVSYEGDGFSDSYYWNPPDSQLILHGEQATTERPAPLSIFGDVKGVTRRGIDVRGGIRVNRDNSTFVNSLYSLSIQNLDTTYSYLQILSSVTNDEGFFFGQEDTGSRLSNPAGTLYSTEGPLVLYAANENDAGNYEESQSWGADYTVFGHSGPAAADYNITLMSATNEMSMVFSDAGDFLNISGGKVHIEHDFYSVDDTYMQGEAYHCSNAAGCNFYWYSDVSSRNMQWNKENEALEVIAPEDELTAKFSFVDFEGTEFGYLNGIVNTAGWDGVNLRSYHNINISAVNDINISAADGSGTIALRGNVKPDCVESHYQLEWSDNAAVASGGYVTLEGVIEQDATHGTPVTIDSTIEEFFMSQDTTTNCPTVQNFSIRVNNQPIDVNITVPNGAKSLATSENLPYNVNKYDNLTIYSDTYSCIVDVDDPQFILRMKVRCD